MHTRPAGLREIFRPFEAGARGPIGIACHAQAQSQPGHSSGSAKVPYGVTCLGWDDQAPCHLHWHYSMMARMPAELSSMMHLASEPS